MAEKRLPVLSESEFESLCECNGTAPCGEAQADGVPCDALGRECECCGRALAYQRDVAAGRKAAEAAADPDALVIVPTEIGA